jgi:hypothetical protein
MRTTVTLDPDVERLIRKAMLKRQVSFKQVLNEAVRDGLKAASRRPANRRFVQKTFPLGAVQHFRWDKALAVAEALEDEEYCRKLEVPRPTT